ncbi:hypothetical protein Ahy_A01g001181 isoform C [Arachis hypogaea]|uniref:Uncharacterized protein n=1 Tax=Arachis hypogaea TaxID=3818 RepID=A0A445EMH4_ARAHY|nr:hypothetical protein Ahy_A01g001181 isoform C [Arachis hypogaea]
MILFQDFQEENMRERGLPVLIGGVVGTRLPLSMSQRREEEKIDREKKRNEAATAVMEVTDAVGSIELHLPQNAVAAVPLPVDAANEGWNNFSDKAQGVKSAATCSG